MDLKNTQLKQADLLFLVVHQAEFRAQLQTDTQMNCFPKFSFSQHFPSEIIKTTAAPQWSAKGTEQGLLRQK